jgi:epoxide hydrolase 4
VTAVTEDVDELVTHRQVLAGDVRLHVAEAGEGPVVLLLHGFPDFWYSWRRQIPALVAAGYRVMAPDMRGYAGSESPEGVDAYRMSRLVADVVGLVEASGEERVTLVGHDWGGAVAWATATRRPDVLERLVILNCPHLETLARGLRHPRQAPRSLYFLYFQLPGLPERSLRALNARGLRMTLRGAALRRDSFSDEDLRRYVQALTRPGGLRGPINYYRAAARSTVRQSRGTDEDRPRRIDLPVLVLWGEQDVALRPELAEPPPSAVSDARVVRLPDAGHWVHLDAAEAVNAELLAFLGERAGS